MKRPLARILLRLWLLALLALGCDRGGPPPARGIALGLFAASPTWDYGPLIDEIAAHLATDVLVVIPLHMAAPDSPGLTATVPEATLRRTLGQARAARLRVTLMPMVDLETPRPGAWRGTLAPPPTWWDSYTQHVLALADLAQQVGAHRLVVGSELCALEADEARWRTLISLIRKRYSGVLTYSANWDHHRSVPFWDALDEVAVTAYFPVATTPLAVPLAEARRFAASLGKPLAITELGYPGLASAAEAPWDHQTGAVPDERLQAELLRVGLEGARAAGAADVFVWNWFGLGGAGDRGFSPQGKPAAAALVGVFSEWARWAP